MSSALDSIQGRTISTTLLTLLMLNIVFWGAIKPTILEAVKLHTRKQEYQTLYEKLKERNQTIQNLTDKAKTYEPYIKKFDFYYPTDGDFSLLIDNLYKILDAYQFKLESVTFSEKINKQVQKMLGSKLTLLTPTTFTCQIRGPLSNLDAFVTQWEATPFAPQVITISYNVNPAKTEQAITIVFIVYKLKYNLAPL